MSENLVDAPLVHGLLWIINGKLFMRELTHPVPLSAAPYAGGGITINEHRAASLLVALLPNHQIFIMKSRYRLLYQGVTLENGCLTFQEFITFLNEYPKPNPYFETLEENVSP